MDEILKQTQDQIKKNIVASFSKSKGRAVPVGTMNAYKEMKMPDGTWKYVGDQGKNHPAVKHLFEGEAKVVGETDNLKKEEVSTEVVHPPESKNLGEAIKKFAEARNTLKGVLPIELSPNLATMKIIGTKEEVEKLKGFGYKVEPIQGEEGKFLVDLATTTSFKLEDKTKTAEPVIDTDLLTNYAGGGIGIELRGVLNNKYERKSSERTFKDRFGQFVKVYGTEGDYLVVKQGSAANFTLIKEADYV